MFKREPMEDDQGNRQGRLTKPKGEYLYKITGLAEQQCLGSQWLVSPRKMKYPSLGIKGMPRPGTFVNLGLKGHTQ